MCRDISFNGVSLDNSMCVCVCACNCVVCIVTTLMHFKLHLFTMSIRILCVCVDLVWTFWGRFWWVFNQFKLISLETRNKMALLLRIWKTICFCKWSVQSFWALFWNGKLWICDSLMEKVVNLKKSLPKLEKQWF